MSLVCLCPYTKHGYNLHPWLTIKKQTYEQIQNNFTQKLEHGLECFIVGLY